MSDLDTLLRISEAKCLLSLHPPQYCYGGRAALSSFLRQEERETERALLWL
jgi:hypothetical protein